MTSNCRKGLFHAPVFQGPVNKQVDGARAALLTMPVPGELDTAVSGEAKIGIALLKKRLGDLAATYMKCAAGDAVAGDIGRGLNASLDASVARERHEVALHAGGSGPLYFDVLGRSKFTMNAIRSAPAADCDGTPQPVK